MPFFGFSKAGAAAPSIINVFGPVSGSSEIASAAANAWTSMTGYPAFINNVAQVAATAPIGGATLFAQAGHLNYQSAAGAGHECGITTTGSNVLKQYCGLGVAYSVGFSTQFLFGYDNPAANQALFIGNMGGGGLVAATAAPSTYAGGPFFGILLDDTDVNFQFCFGGVKTDTGIPLVGGPVSQLLALTITAPGPSNAAISLTFQSLEAGGFGPLTKSVVYNTAGTALYFYALAFTALLAGFVRLSCCKYTTQNTLPYCP